jgi:hypothetical protein
MTSTGSSRPGVVLGPARSALAVEMGHALV